MPHVVVCGLVGVHIPPPRPAPRGKQCSYPTLECENGEKIYVFFSPQCATLTGLEPATSAVTGRRANQLRHRAILS